MRQRLGILEKQRHTKRHVLDGTPESSGNLVPINGSNISFKEAAAALKRSSFIPAR
jgi:hypothetical protein